MCNHIKECQVSKRKLFVLLYLIFISLFCIAITILTINPDRIMTSSMCTQQREKIVTRVLVKQNDTLWDYACQYYSQEYKNVQELIVEIKKTNGLSGDMIKEGSYLLIPHYVTTELEM